MNTKATAIAPVNIAFIKYWGKKDEVLRLPANKSISMNIDNLLTTTTVEFIPGLQADSITVNGSPLTKGNDRVIAHLDRVRALASIDEKAKVVSKFNFPMGTGLSSSASGFAALTVAAVNAAGISLNQQDLSILTRQGSGSACRSIPDGFAEWLDGDSGETSYAISIFPSDWWDIRDVVVILTSQQKEVTSTEGQRLHTTSPFFDQRLQHMKTKIDSIKQYIRQKDFHSFGELIESEALEMHAVMITSRPPLLYWTPETLTLMKHVMRWRSEGLGVYFTINTGQNVHLICRPKDEDKVVQLVQSVFPEATIISNKPANGAKTTLNHLF